MSDELDPAERALFTARTEQARLLHILADRVQCGCADVAWTVVYDALRPNEQPGTILVQSRACLDRDHQRDWPVLNLEPMK